MREQVEMAKNANSVSMLELGSLCTRNYTLMNRSMGIANALERNRQSCPLIVCQGPSPENPHAH